MRTLRHLLAALLLIATTTAQADSWSYPPEVTTRAYSYGDVRVVTTTDARVHRKVPDFLLEIFRGETRVAQIPGLSFEQLFVSNDNRLFLGLSNNGIPGTAVVLFNDRGDLLLLADHGMAEFDYCEKSVTLVRTWFDAANPNVRFRLGEEEAKPGIYVRTCKGNDVEILDAVRKAYARAGSH